MEFTDFATTAIVLATFIFAIAVLVILKKNNRNTKTNQTTLKSYIKTKTPKKPKPTINTKKTYKTCPQCRQRFKKSEYKFRKEGNKIITEEKCPKCGFILTTTKT